MLDSPRFVELKDANAKLPGKDYVRIIGKHFCPLTRKEVAHHYAVTKTSARHCKLLEPFLDAADLDLSDEVDLLEGLIRPVVIPHASAESCTAVFTYLEILESHVPSVISRPLRGPLQACIQEWEISLLCSIISEEKAKKTSSTKFSHLPEVSQHTRQSLDLLLEIALVSDFLMIEPLCDLCSAYLASLAVSAKSEEELLQMWGIETPLTEEDLAAVYDQFPFLKVEEA